MPIPEILFDLKFTLAVGTYVHRVLMASGSSASTLVECVYPKVLFKWFCSCSGCVHRFRVLSGFGLVVCVSKGSGSLEAEQLREGNLRQERVIARDRKGQGCT